MPFENVVRRTLFETDERVEVVFAPLPVLHRDTVRIVNGVVSFVFTNDPALVVPEREPFGDLVEVELPGSHLGPRLGSVSGEILVVDVFNLFSSRLAC